MNDTNIYNKKPEVYFCPVSAVAENMLYFSTQCGHHVSKNGYLVDRPTYPLYLVFYVLDGNGHATANGRKFSFTKGDLVLIDTTRPHSYYSDEPLDFYWLHFGGSMSDEICRLVDSFEANVINNVNFSLAKTNLIDIIIQYRNEATYSESDVSVKIHTLLCEFIKNTAGIPDLQKDKLIFSAINYIKANYKKPLTIEEIAVVVSLSPFHFSRIFKRSVGFSPYEYLIKTRISAAQVLLTTTKKLVKEIAFEAGFTSETGFVTSFKKNIGMTPCEFRKLKITQTERT